jgi:hypothetical protein
MANCPKCEVEIARDQILDTNYDVDFVIVEWNGCCPCCDTAYSWKEVFRFEFSEDLKED